MSVSRLRRVTAAMAAAVTCAVVVPAVSGQAAQAQAPALPADLVAVVSHTSLLGTHTWYRQTFRGLPVLDSYYVVHAGTDGATTVDDGRLAVPAALDPVASVAADGAVGAAGAAVAARAAEVSKTAAGRTVKDGSPVPAFGAAKRTLAVVGGASPALVWDVVSTSPDGDTETRVDAHTGAVLAVTVLSKNVNGSGKVFDPNPVVSQRDESLVDRNDRDVAVPAAAYRTVTLPNLLGGAALRGTWALITDSSVPLASSANRVYAYTRTDDRFEQVNAYYGVDKAQTYIQSLGFTDINHEAQKLSIDTITVDNSFYSPDTDTITYGTGGVDDAEDLEVVWHEYGHAIQDAQVPGFGSTEQGGAIGEGFGDYWAVTMSQSTSRGFDLPCVMDWDSTSYTSTVPHCLRRTDTGKTTDDVTNEVHDDGEIWSNALWDINLGLGRKVANTIILESQFSYLPNTNFVKAANRVVATARSLYGASAATTVRQAFVARKILT